MPARIENNIAHGMAEVTVIIRSHPADIHLHFGTGREEFFFSGGESIIYLQFLYPFINLYGLFVPAGQGGFSNR